jgi:hypothetical protein
MFQGLVVWLHQHSALLLPVVVLELLVLVVLVVNLQNLVVLVEVVQHLLLHHIELVVLLLLLDKVMQEEL